MHHWKSATSDKVTLWSDTNTHGSDKFSHQKFMELVTILLTEDD